MTTAADYEPELVDALNLLIEDERASVEMEVALASGATEYAERETLARMGAEDIRSCETLRGEMERAGLPVTPQINGVVFEVLGAERYDDRLRAFAHHQRIVADRASDLLESNLEGEIRAALVNIVSEHQRHIEWTNRRADEFAATRLMEFGLRQRDQYADAATLPAAPETAAAPSEPVALPDIPPMDIPEEAPTAPMEEAVAVEAPVGELAEAPAAAPETLELEADMPGAPATSETPPLEPPASESPESPESQFETRKAAEASAEPTAEPSTPRVRRGRPRKDAPPAE